MIRRFARWMRVVLPPWWAVLLFLAVYLCLESLYLWLRWWMNVREVADFLRIRDVIVGACCATYGSFRVLAFHPLARPAYFRWLEQTPWTSRKPLMLGPIHLVVQDVVVLSVAVLMVHGSPARLIMPPMAFLGAYLFFLWLSCCTTGQTWIGYLLAFGLGLAVRLVTSWPMAACALGLLYPLAWLGLQRSLARFPWKAEAWWEESFAQAIVDREKPIGAVLGWPFTSIGPKEPDRPLSYRNGVLISLLIGSWMYALGSRLPPDQLSVGLLTATYRGAASAFILGRVLMYCRCCWPPISLCGRLATLRWIIPGYDQVFVAPICAALIAIFAPWGLSLVGVPGEIALPICLSAVVGVVLNMGPTLRRWQLTGDHRIMAFGSQAQQSLRRQLLASSRGTVGRR